MIKNDYTIQNNPVPIWFPERVWVIFSHNELAYSYFQDKKQYEFENVIAQVGGFLAVCIGFNLLRTTKVLLFYKPKKHSEIRKTDGKRRRNRRARLWRKNFIDNIKRLIPCASDDDPTVGFRHDMQVQMAALKERVEADKTTMDAMEGQLESLQKDMVVMKEQAEI